MNTCRISVCMATYNGLPYLEAQLCSILEQLGAGDEVVIVDDGSKDGSREYLKAHGDSRLRVLFHEKNTGPVGAFEDALRAAKGEYLFLSDQDDIWPADKVAKYMEIFALRPEIEILCSKVRLIDEAGNLLDEVNAENERPFRTGLIANLIHNCYQGSTMAMRAHVLHKMLPFPRGGERCQLLHDLWIGLRAAQCGYGVMRIEEPLLLYRRHGNNVSGRLPLLRQIEKRVRVLAALLWR